MGSRTRYAQWGTLSSVQPGICIRLDIGRGMPRDSYPKVHRGSHGLPRNHAKTKPETHQQTTTINKQRYPFRKGHALKQACQQECQSTLTRSSWHSWQYTEPSAKASSQQVLASVAALVWTSWKRHPCYVCSHFLSRVCSWNPEPFQSWQDNNYLLVYLFTFRVDQSTALLHPAAGNLGLGLINISLVSL